MDIKFGFSGFKFIALSKSTNAEFKTQTIKILPLNYMQMNGGLIEIDLLISLIAILRFPALYLALAILDKPLKRE